MQENIAPGYTRISSIIGLTKMHLLSRINKERLQQKTDIGSEVHNAIEAHIKGLYLPVSERARPYLESFYQWWESYGEFKIVACEERFYCDKLKITGKCDLILQLPLTKPTLIDFKTCASEDKCFWPIQAAYYRYLAEVNHIETDNKVFFLKLHPKGKMPVLHTYRIDEQITRLCISFLDHYRYVTHFHDFDKKQE